MWLILGSVPETRPSRCLGLCCRRLQIKWLQSVQKHRKHYLIMIWSLSICTIQLWDLIWKNIYMILFRFLSLWWRAHLLTIQALTKGLVRSCVGPHQLENGYTASSTRWPQETTSLQTSHGTCPWLYTQEGSSPRCLEERDFISYANLHYQTLFSFSFEE